MKKIEITEESVEIYQKFYEIKTGNKEIKHPGLFTVVASIGALLVFGIIGSGFLGYMVILKHIITTLGITLANTNTWIFSFFTTISTLSYFGIIGFFMSHCLPKILSKTRMKKFKKNYPGFDTNINLEELEKELNKYYILSKLPKDLEKQEEEHFSLYQEKKKEMTLEEQLIALEKERTFLMQLKTKEELKKENQTEENYQKKKTM